MSQIRCDLAPAVGLFHRVVMLKPEYEYLQSLDDSDETNPCAFAFATSLCPAYQDESDILAAIHRLALKYDDYKSWLSLNTYEDVRYRRVQLIKLGDDIEDILLLLPDMTIDNMVIYYNKVLDELEEALTRHFIDE